MVHAYGKACLPAKLKMLPRMLQVELHQVVLLLLYHALPGFKELHRCQFEVCSGMLQHTGAEIAVPGSVYSV